MVDVNISGSNSNQDHSRFLLPTNPKPLTSVQEGKNTMLTSSPKAGLSSLFYACENFSNFTSPQIRARPGQFSSLESSIAARSQASQSNSTIPSEQISSINEIQLSKFNIN